MHLGPGFAYGRPTPDACPIDIRKTPSFAYGFRRWLISVKPSRWPIDRDWVQLSPSFMSSPGRLWLLVARKTFFWCASVRTSLSRWGERRDPTLFSESSRHVHFALGLDQIGHFRFSKKKHWQNTSNDNFHESVPKSAEQMLWVEVRRHDGTRARCLGREIKISPR